ncbi:MAG: flagellar hook-length control protein FliK, partial [Chloroflexi bacterium]|nr:flagellar hook-length control protein FliK [Chloroflexota bacterium]
GRAVEHDLAKLLTAISDQSARSADSALRLKPQPDLLGLAQLSGELKGAVPQARTLIGEIDRFLDAARLAQFANAAPDGVPARRESDDATTINLSLPLGRPDRAPAAAHLRVAYRPDGEADPREPGRERLATLVLRVELERGQSLEVELSVVERQVGARVTASHGDLRDRAEAELPGLASGLRNLGFTLKTARFEVGQAGGEKAKDDRRSKTELAA